ncbi:hypothetical protein AKG08_04560 [Achromobacter piechaudii]|nr:hypothetical protein AKG08_04560 [Achromobacter piechaudii]
MLHNLLNISNRNYRFEHVVILNIYPISRPIFVGYQFTYFCAKHPSLLITNNTKYMAPLILGIRARHLVPEVITKVLPIIDIATPIIWICQTQHNLKSIHLFFTKHLAIFRKRNQCMRIFQLPKLDIQSRSTEFIRKHFSIHD